MLTTPITQRLNLTAPIISAGMAFAAHPPLVAAVSNAGGMGTLGAAMLPPEALSAMIQQIRQQTQKPFGIDFVTDFTTDAHIDVCIAASVPVVVFFWSLPPGVWVERLQSHGIQVWMEVGAIAEAIQAKALGVDAIIAQGKESGGSNKAEASTFNLLPAICRAVSPTPVIAAGGIIDGMSLVAAIALGAEAVWCGTRFLASLEANAHPEYKARVLQANVGDTVITRLFGPEWPGHQMRVLRNRVVNQWAEREAEVDYADFADETIGTTLMGDQTVSLPKFSVILPTPETTGDFEEMGLTAGESSGNIHELQPAATIVQTMMAEATQVIEERLYGRIRSPMFT